MLLVTVYCRAALHLICETIASSETRFAEIGEIKEVGACYTFFRSKRKIEEWREAGVGFAIKSDLVGKLSGSPNDIKTSFVWQ